MKLFDPHVHLTSERYDDDLPEVIARLREAGLTGCMVICDPGDREPDCARAAEIVEQNPGFFLAIGVHPHNANGFSPEVEREIRRYAARGDCVCLGEIGLDYYDGFASSSELSNPVAKGDLKSQGDFNLYDFSPREVQRDVFERQLDLALELNLPVQLHIRDAHGEAIERLQARHRAGRLPRGVMHCYSGSWESAKTYLSMGLYISLSGVATFRNAPKVWEVAKNLPEDRLLVETDCPYMAPAPMRGKRNEPAFLRYTLERVAELRETDPERLAERIGENLNALFFR
ncbi:MAG: TatD family hydrolase [Clostridiales bacterium]|jgi:TatD DNase family protein|nr:TatD family hydrolase [Clostridiales bacterium]